MLRRSTWIVGSRLLTSPLNAVQPWTVSKSVRSVSTAAQIEREIKDSAELFAPSKYKPPLQLYGIPGRYASACWSAAARHNKLGRVEGELLSIKQVLDKYPDFFQNIADPTILRKKRIQAAREMATQIKVDAIIRNLFVLLSERGRIGLLAKIIENYRKIMRAHRKESDVKVTTAEPLSAEEQKQLKQSLKNRLIKDRKIVLELIVEPEIVGGMIVEWDDAFRLDLSVANSIKRLETELRSGI